MTVVRLFVLLLSIQIAHAFSPWPHSQQLSPATPNMESFRNAIQKFRNEATSTLGSTAAAAAATAVTSPSSATTGTNEQTAPSTPPKKKQSKIRAALSSKLFACLVAFGVGMRLGIKSAGEVSSASTIAGRAKQFPLASLLLMVLTVRQVYQSIPAWAKKKRAKSSSTSDVDDPNDMASWAAISVKLQALLDVASKRLTTTVPSSKVRTALYAIVQLSSQIKHQQPQVRDQAYDESGTIVDAQVVLKDYDIYFEFADWAYDEYPNGENEVEETLQERLATRNYDLLKHDTTALPGRVGHYVALCEEENTVLIGVKGSSSFEDMLTDCCGLAVPETLPAPFVKGGSPEIFAHEGILISSKRLADDLEPFIRYLAIPNGFKVFITGHSLGAGAAAMLGMLLRSRFPKLQSNSRLQVMAFASPPILDREAALACVPFTTTVVNNADIIPRASLHNLAIMLELSTIVNGKLEEKGIANDDFKSMAAFMKFMSEGKDGEMIMSPDEIKQAMQVSIDKVDESDPDFLFVPGRVVHMYDLWSKKGYQEAEKEVEVEAEDRIEPEEESVKTAERVYEGTGTSQVLKDIEMDERMVMDHLSGGYRGSIKSLLETTNSKC